MKIRIQGRCLVLYNNVRVRVPQCKRVFRAGAATEFGVWRGAYVCFGSVPSVCSYTKNPSQTSLPKEPCDLKPEYFGRIHTTAMWDISALSPCQPHKNVSTSPCALRLPTLRLSTLVEFPSLLTRPIIPYQDIYIIFPYSHTFSENHSYSSPTITVCGSIPRH